MFSHCFFALPLCCYECEQVAATAEQTTVCGLHYPRSRVRTKSSDLSEKMVSKKTVTSLKLGDFSPFFSCCRSSEMNASGWRHVGVSVIDRGYGSKM